MLSDEQNHYLFASVEIEWSKCILFFILFINLLSTFTSRDVIFRYPDRVPQKFLACGPEFSVEFSAPPEFSGGVTEKYLSTGWARTFYLQIRKQIFYHCATAPLCIISYDIHCVPSWDFPAVSVVTGSRIFRTNLIVTCRDFPAVSAVIGSWIFRPYQVVTCRDFAAVSAVTGSRIFWPYL